MKILIPAVSSATRPDGVSRHAINLAHSLLLQAELHHVSVQQVDFVIGAWQQPYMQQLLGPPDPRLRLHIACTGPSSLARNLWYFTQLPRLAHSLRSDLLHATYPVPLDRSRIPCPVVVTLHDLYPYDIPRNFGFPRVLLNRLILRQCLAAADAIACVSDSTLTRLHLRFPAHRSKASVIPNIVKHQPSATPIAALQDEPFILSVAQHRRNKNLPLTLAVFRRILHRHPGMCLVLVGNEGPETRALRKSLDLYNLLYSVIFLHGIRDQQLQWCYRNCKLLLATSTIEGFGLPVAEAMLAGCPVLCTDIPAFRELTSIDLVPLGLPAAQSLALAAEQIFKDPRPQPISLPRFAPSVVARRYLHLYRNLINAAQPAVAPSPQFHHQKGRVI